MKYLKFLLASLQVIVCSTAFAFQETAPDATQETTGILLNDNFDSYAAGSFPSSWELIYNGAGTSQQIVDTTRFVSSPKSLRLVGSSCWSANAYRPVNLPLPSSGQLVSMTVKVFSGAIVSGGCGSGRAAATFFNPSGGTWGRSYGGVKFDEDGFIYAIRNYYDESLDLKLMAYSPQKWYNIKTQVNLSAKTMNIYIDGVLYASNARIYDLDYSLPTGIQLSAGHGNTPIIWFDDVSVSTESPALSATTAYWKFEEGSGVGFLDNYSAGARNNGVLINGASYASSAHSAASKYSVLFDGSDDIAAIPDSPTLRPKRITVEAWIKPQSGARVVVGKQLGSDCCVNSFQIELNHFRFQLTDTNGEDHIITAPVNPAANQWHHVAGTWDGATMKLYLDKKLVASGAFAGAIRYDRNPILIGGDDDGSGVPGGALFKGLIDEVRISNRALTISEFMP
jgi:hypothetical protein